MEQTVAQLLKVLPIFKKAEKSLPHSQERTIGLGPEPDKSHVHLSNTFLCDALIIFQSTPSGLLMKMVMPF